jgi:two-component system phosphate regulon sensor histidine kinase PhoR
MQQKIDMPRQGGLTLLLARLGRRALHQRWVIAVAGLIALAALALAPQWWLLTLAGLLALLAAALLASPPPPGRRADDASGAARQPARPLSPEVQALATALPDPCLLLSADGRIAFQNQRARDVLGTAQTGRPVSALLRAPDISEAVRTAIAEQRETSVEYFERIPVARWFEAHVAPVYEPATPTGNAPPKLMGLVLVLHDLTQQQRVERMRVDFVANASHELRTPLASLAGFIETLQSSARDDPQARERFLEIMRTQAVRMSRLIADLLSLSRIELNAHLRPSTRIDVFDILSHVVDTLRPLAEAEGVEIDLSRPPDPGIVAGDRDELVQVFQNLIENAIKYGASGKRVEVTAKCVEGARTDHAEIAIRDFGPGIAREHVPRLTERFYRVDEAHSREKGGTGLGLAIAKHILNRHRATLDISSTPGEGACFTVRLELQTSPPSTGADMSKPEGGDNNADKTTG